MESTLIMIRFFHFVFQLREDFDGGGEIAFCEDVAIHDVATLLKEFFRDLPEPLIPKELLPGLLAVQSKCDRSS